MKDVIIAVIRVGCFLGKGFWAMSAVRFEGFLDDMVCIT